MQQPLCVGSHEKNRPTVYVTTNLFGFLNNFGKLALANVTWIKGKRKNKPALL